MVCDGSEGLSYIEPLPLAGDEKIFLKIARKLSTLNMDKNLLKKIRNLKISKVEITKKNHLSFPRLASPVFTIAGATARGEERPVRVS